VNPEPTPVGSPPTRAELSLERLREVALLFLKLGATSFGGPASHIAMMEGEVVGKRQWLTRQQFLDMLGAANLIPGPSSTELAINVGFVRAGWAGLCVAGASFILPAALITGAFAWAYVRFGALPQAASALGGVKAAVISVIAIAIWRLGKTAVRSVGLAALGVVALAAFFLGLNPIVILFGGGLVGILARRAGSLRATNAMFLSPTIVWRALIAQVGGESWAVSWRAAAAVAAVGPLVTRPALSRIALFF
jgi:chromate transporter